MASTRVSQGWGRAERRTANALALGMMLANLLLGALMTILWTSAMTAWSETARARSARRLRRFGGSRDRRRLAYRRHRPRAGQWALAMGLPVAAAFLPPPRPHESNTLVNRTGTSRGRGGVCYVGRVRLPFLGNGRLAFILGRKVLGAGEPRRGESGALDGAIDVGAAGRALDEAYHVAMVGRLGGRRGQPGPAIGRHLRPFLLATSSRSGTPRSRLRQRAHLSRGRNGFRAHARVGRLAAVIAILAICRRHGGGVHAEPSTDAAGSGRWLTAGLDHLTWAGRCPPTRSW